MMVAVDAERRMRVVVVVVVVAETHLMRLSCLSSMDLTEQMLLSFLEELVRKLPSVRYNLPKTLETPTTTKRRRQ